MTESSLSRAKCPSCSEPVSGNFCSVCGTSLLDGGKSSIEELPIIGELVTFVRTYWKILRSPIAEPVRLTESPGYQDHFKFLMLGVGIYVAYLVFMATMAREGTGVSGFTPDQQSFIDNYKYLVVINYGVAALLAYGLFRILAAKTLNFKTHVKLWAILTGFYMPLQMLLLIVYAIVYAGGGAVMAENAAQFRSGLSAAGPWIGQAFNLVMLVHFAVVHARIWVVALWVSLAIFIAVYFLTPVPANLFQYAFGFVLGYFNGLFST